MVKKDSNTFLNTSMEDALDPKWKWHEKNICINHHFSAPLVLMISIPFGENENYELAARVRDEIEKRAR